MEIDMNRSAWIKPAALLLILNICGHFQFVRGACSASDITANVLPSAWTTMNIPYKYWDTTTSANVFYINRDSPYLNSY